MKICLVSYEYPPETFNGIGTYTRNLAESLARSCEKVSVITFTSKKPHSYVQNGVNVHRINAVRVKSLWRFEWLIPSKLLSYSIAVSNKISELLESETFDLIEGPDIRAELFIHLLRTRRSRVIPVVIKLHTPSYVVQKYNFKRISLSERFMNFMEKYCITHADALYSPSRSLRNIVAKDYNISEQKIGAIPNPIDITSYRPAKDNNDTTNVKILYAGRIEKRKGVEVLVRAIPQVLEITKNVNFMFVGADTNSGKDRTSLAAELSKYLHDYKCDGHFEFIARQEKAELIKIYQSADIFVIPSLFENFAYTCLEAMACGKPVIGSDVGGMPEIITNEGTGLLIPPGDENALAHSIIQLCNNVKLRERFGENARIHIVNSFSCETISSDTLKYYNTVIGLKKKVVDE